jgi:hypothetical protein
LSTPASIRLPNPLRERIRERARAERRSFSNTARVLLEVGLAAPTAAVADVDADEVERLERLYHETVDLHRPEV